MKPMGLSETKARAIECLSQLLKDVISDILTVQSWEINQGIPIIEYRVKVYDTPKKSTIDSAMGGCLILSPEDVELLQSAYPNIGGASADYMAQFRKILGIELVYEWEWVLRKQDDSELCRSKFMTDAEYAHEECVREFLTKFEKDESTKRERVK